VKAVNIKHIIQSLAVLTLLLFSAGNTSAQKSPLNREVTLNAPGIAVQDALLLLGEESNMNFSYNSSLIDKSRKVDLNASNARLGSVLDDIIQEDVQYKVVGNHIVLLADNTPKVSAKEVVKTGYSISGYIYDSSTGKVIRSATIYDVGGERSSITDNAGFYSILVPPGDDFKGLTYCKDGYMDTVIIVKPADDLTLDMRLSPVLEEVRFAMVTDTAVQTQFVLEKPTFTQHRIVDAVIPSDALSHSNNLVLYEHKIGQVSFLPFSGVHSSRNGVYINRFSLNILAGYTGGVDGIEIGGLLNVDRNYVNGLQVAGFGNIVGKKTRGLQVAGFTNINIGSIVGVQVAGFNNVTNDTITGVQVAGFTNYLRGAMNGVQVSGFYNHLVDGANGVQAAGFVNYAGRDFKGVQAAGFMNVAIDSVYGAQLAGFANFQRGEMIGLQAAGFTNISWGKVSGGQAAGFANFSVGEVIGGQVAGFANVSLGEIDGAQVAGFSNLAFEADSGIQVAGFMNVSVNDYNGVQVAGFLNRAKGFKGLQVAVINSSDSSEGYSIGLFNYVHHGYRAFEFSADEVLYANFTFKTGNHKLYNIYNVGVQPFNNTWGVGFGFGSYTRLGKKFHVFEEITSNAINEDAVWEQRINLQNKISLGLDYQMSDKIALFASAAFNVHVLGRDRESNEFSSNVPFLPFYTREGTNVQTSMWVGGKVGMRFVLSH
jgi:hypothetical protein